MRPAIALLLALCTFAAGALAKDADGLPDAAHRSYLQNYKDMALAACIAKAYAAAPAVAADARASAGAYFEWSAYDVDASTGRLDALIDRQLAKTYGSWQGPSVTLTLMKCIDLSHSAELDALGRQYTARPNATFADDERKRR